MRILFLSLMLPYPADNGHKMRGFSLLRALHEEGHDIDLLTFAQPDEMNGSNSPLREVCREIIAVPQKKVSLSASANYLGRFRGLFSARPFGLDRFTSAAMKESICRQLEHMQFDAIVCDTIHVMANLPADSPPVIVNNNDVEYLILERFAAQQSNPAKRVYSLLESRKVRQWEQRACQRATLAMACSEHDRHLLQRLCPDVPVTLVPNTIDVETYQPGRRTDPLTVLYQGGMDWLPNRDAVEFFIAKILPRLRMYVPGIRFIVAGRNPSPEFLARYADFQDVEFTGTVPDMRPIIAQATVCVVPLRIGSGTRLKILESAAMGKPIVSTRLGAEGLEFREGTEIVLADEPEAFAREVASLLQDPSKRTQMGMAARKNVEQKYDFAALRCALRASLARLQPMSLDGKVEVVTQ